MKEVLEIKQILDRSDKDNCLKNLFEQVDGFDSYVKEMGIDISKKQLIINPFDNIPSFNWVK